MVEEDRARDEDAGHQGDVEVDHERLGQLGEDELLDVSYTHLTLPTSDLV